MSDSNVTKIPDAGKAAFPVSNSEFLDTIFPPDWLNEDETVPVCFFDESPADRKFWTARHRSELTDDSETHNTYYAIATCTKQPTLSRRRVEFKGLWVMVLDDIGTGPGAKTRPEDIPLEPTYALLSSEDNYQYGYALADPVRDVWVADVLVARLKQAADKGGSNLIRYVRLPFGANTKADRCAANGAPFQCRLTEWQPDREYSVDDLLTAFGHDLVEFYAEVEEKKQAKARSVTLAAGEYARDELLFWLERSGRLLSDAGSESSGFYEISCPWGEHHTTGDDGAGYSPVGEGAGEYKSGQQFRCLHDHCADRDCGDLYAVMFNERYVFMPGGNAGYVGDLLRPGLEPISVSSFKAKYGAAKTWVRDPSNPNKKPVAQKVPPMWLESPTRIDVDAVGYRPGEPLIYHNELGKRFLNRYEPRRHDYMPWSARKPYVKMLLRHLRYMIPDAVERRLVHDWLAWVVARPEQRPHFHVLSIAAKQGTGRGWIAKLMTDVLGPWQVAPAQDINTMLTSQFSGLLHAKRFIDVPEIEMRGPNRFNTQSAFKTQLDTNRREYNLKYGGQFEDRDYSAFWMASNMANALALDDEDRRVCVVRCASRVAPQDYFRDIYQYVDLGPHANEMARAIYWHFMERSLAAFAQLVRAPMTLAKRQLIDTNTSVDAHADVIEAVRKLALVGVKAFYLADLERAVYGGTLRELDMRGQYNSLAHLLTNDLDCIPVKRIKQKSAYVMPGVREEWNAQLRAGGFAAPVWAAAEADRAAEVMRGMDLGGVREPITLLKR